MHDNDRLKHLIFWNGGSILPFTNTDVSRHILVLDTSVFVKKVLDISVFANDNMDRREYHC
jgi:hypothetical protein